MISFRVPNESETAGTIKLEVSFPADHPVTSARTTPQTGRTAEITKSPLATPIERNGSTITLTAAESGGHGQDAAAAGAEAGDTPSTDNTARWLAGAGPLLGALGLGLGGGAALRGWRDKSRSSS